MANQFSENPYESPTIRAELVETPRHRRKRKPLPVVALGLLWAVTLAATFAITLIDPEQNGPIMGGLFCFVSGVILVGMVGYEVWSWFCCD
jgi:hypothetical protein